MKLLLDTNILTRLVNPAHPDLRDAAERVCETLRTQGCILCVAPQSIYEFWSVATRPRSANGLEFSIEQTRSEVDAILILFALLRDERAIFEPWLNLVTSHGVQGKTTHDARLVAAMLRHGVSHLLTFNTGDFVRYSEIAAVHPDDVLAGRVLESTE